MDRRKFIAAGASLVGGLSLPSCGQRARLTENLTRLTAEPVSLRVFSDQMKHTDAWGYNGAVAGPMLHMRRGETTRLLFENKILQPTSIHWHGLRIPFEMDGVGSITQPGIVPGESFLYEFSPPDAGLFWYHPHMNSEEQMSRGMFGLILVEEENPPPADREVIWSLYDWGLNSDYQVPEKKAFQLWRGITNYRSHTKLTTDGMGAPDILMREGERVRLRIANTSSVRRYALNFEGHNPWIIAWDSNAVEPYRVGDGPLIIGTGARVDLMLDGTGKAGETFAIQDVFNSRYEPIPPWETPEETAARKPEHLCNIVYRDEPALRKVSELGPATAPILNHIPEPDLASAIPIDIEMSNLAMPIRDLPGIGPLASVFAKRDGISPDEVVTLWAMNGEVLLEDLESYNCVDPSPMFACKLGHSYLLRFKNTTNVDHPMHLHGHTFKMIRRNGEPFAGDVYRDTFTLFAGETIEIAFLADNPGEWMIHCHRGMHQHSGMMSLFTVA